MPATMKNIIALAIIFSISLVEAVPYSKYGRTCNDIGCPSTEECVIATDKCTYSNSRQCGSYPTCKKKTNFGEPNCSTMNCPTGQKCRVDNGSPVCVASQDYESNTYNQGSHNSNSNPYENANAPPEDDVFGTPMKPYSGNTNTNLGYPSYPNSGSNGGNNNNNNNGYPPYPTNQQPPRNDGYPPYPTNNNNRMPIPGQSGYPPYGGQSNYPQSNNNQYPLHPPPGYQSNNGQRYPSYGNYPNNYYSQSNSRNYYRPNSSVSSMTGSTITMIMMLTSCFALLTISRNTFVP